MSDGRIIDARPYGAHIPLRCKNHPHLRWSAKNIAPLGCRSIFFDLWMEAAQRGEQECSCPLSDLEPVPPAEWVGNDHPE